MHRRPDAALLGLRRRRRAVPSSAVLGAAACRRRLMSSTGTSTRRSKAFRAPASTIATGRGFHLRTPAAAEEARDRPRAAAASPTGRCAAAAGASTSSSRSSDSARWAPRLVPATAWISSTITVSTPTRASRAPRGEQQEQRLRRRDQDVGRLCAASARARRGRVAGADRRRSARGTRSPRRSAACAMPAIGARRLRSTSTGERLERRDVDDAAALALGGRAPNIRRSIAAQERGERLARAGRREDERARSRRRSPARRAAARASGRRKRLGEPLPDAPGAKGSPAAERSFAGIMEERKGRPEPPLW